MAHSKPTIHEASLSFFSNEYKHIHSFHSNIRKISADIESQCMSFRSIKDSILLRSEEIKVRKLASLLKRSFASYKVAIHELRKQIEHMITDQREEEEKLYRKTMGRAIDCFAYDEELLSMRVNFMGTFITHAIRHATSRMSTLPQTDQMLSSMEASASTYVVVDPPSTSHCDRSTDWPVDPSSHDESSQQPINNAVDLMPVRQANEITCMSAVGTPNEVKSDYDPSTNGLAILPNTPHSSLTLLTNSGNHSNHSLEPISITGTAPKKKISDHLAETRTHVHSNLRFSPFTRPCNNHRLSYARWKDYQSVNQTLDSFVSSITATKHPPPLNRYSIIPSVTH